VAVIPSRTSTERDELGHRLEYMNKMMERTVLALDSKWTWVGHGKTIMDLIKGQAKEKTALQTCFIISDQKKPGINREELEEAAVALVNFWVFAGELAKQYGYSIYLKLPASKTDMLSDYKYSHIYGRQDLLRAMPDRKYAVFNLGNQTEMREKLRERVADIVSHLDRFSTEAYILYAPSDISLDDPFFK
jgi:hypothetical protein